MGDDLVLHLGEEVAFPEMYVQSYPGGVMKVVYPEFFDQRFLSFLHWMVYEWYSTYKSVMRYFVSMEVEELLMREGKGGRGKRKEERGKVGEQGVATPCPMEVLGGQTLVIFPDNWTRVNMMTLEPPVPTAVVDDPLQKGVCLQLFSTDTQNRKDINWWTIKKGGACVITATQSEVFQPFSALKKIIFVDPQKWYYHNQQDPRYSLPVVVQKMAEIYGAEVVEVRNIGRLAFGS